jgi:hypothetical protein
VSYQVKLKSLPVITVTAAAQKISETKIKASLIEIHAVSTNAGAVYVGDSGVTIGNSIPILANATKAYTPSEISSSVQGDYFDLSDFHVVGTAGDLVRIQYMQKGE